MSEVKQWWCCKAEFGSHEESCPRFGSITLQSRLSEAEAAIDAVREHPAAKSCDSPALGNSVDEYTKDFYRGTALGVYDGHRCAAIPCNEYRAKYPKEGE